MIIGIRDVYYSVTDANRAKRFYLEVLGCTLKFEHEGWIALDCGGVTIGLRPEDHPIPHIPRDAHGAHAGATITFQSNNIPEDRKRIEAFGGCKVLGEANEDWGHMLVFEDPDGNVLKLMNPKY